MAPDTPRKKSRFFKFAVGAAVGFLALIIVAKVALKIILPPEKARAMVKAQVEAALNREVRIGNIGLSLFRGLVIEELEVSERPDFKAGVFGGVEAFELTIHWKALLRKKIVVDRVLLIGPHVRVVAKKNGKFNFSDLIEEDESAEKKETGKEKTPKSKSPLDLELNISEGRISGGKIVYLDQASGEEWTVANINAFATNFSFSEPFEAGLSLLASNRGGDTRVSASFSMDTRIDLSRQSQGKYDVSLKKLELETADPVPLDIWGEGKIAVTPDLLNFWLDGTLGENDLDIKLKVKDYAKSPKIRFDLSLSRLDLAKLMPSGETKEEESEKEDEKQKKAPPKKAAKKSPPMSAAGEIKIGEIVHPGFSAKDFALVWDLKGITPKMNRLRGAAGLDVGVGEIKLLGAMAEQSALLQVAAAPLTLLSKLGSLGGLKILPDLSSIAFTEIVGRYSFRKGLMTLEETRLTGPSAKISAAGTVDLGKEKLNLQVTAKLAKFAPIKVMVTGTFDKPKTKIKAGAVVTQPAQKLLKPAEKLLRGLFKRKKK